VRQVDTDDRRRRRRVCEWAFVEEHSNDVMMTAFVKDYIFQVQLQKIVIKELICYWISSMQLCQIDRSHF